MKGKSRAGCWKFRDGQTYKTKNFEWDLLTSKSYTITTSPKVPVVFFWKINVQSLLRNLQNWILNYTFFRIWPHFSWRTDKINVTDRMLYQECFFCAHKIILTLYNVILNVIKHLKMKNQLKIWVVSEKKIKNCPVRHKNGTSSFSSFVGRATYNQTFPNDSFMIGTTLKPCSSYLEA